MAFGRFALFLPLLVTLGCSVEPTDPSPVVEAAGPPNEPCSQRCVVWSQGSNSQLLLAESDSARVGILLGDISFTRASGRVDVDATHPGSVRMPSSLALRVVEVETGREVGVYPLRAGHVELLPSAGEAAMRRLSLWLVGSLTPGEERDVRKLTLWATPRLSAQVRPLSVRSVGARSGARAISVLPCAFVLPGLICNNQVVFNRYSSSTRWSPNGWQSNAGSGVSKQIIITFSRRIQKFAVTIYDADYPTNEMVALDSAGAVVASVSATNDGTPGVPPSEVLSIAGAGIRSIVLNPGAADYVGFSDASFENDSLCPPVSDSVVSSAAFRAAMEAALAASLLRPDSAETKGVIFKYDITGALRYQQITPTSANMCAVTFSFPAPGQDEKYFASYHSHPIVPGTMVTCPGEPPGRFNPKRLGGGSLDDWQNVDAATAQLPYNFPGYIIDAGFNIYRLDSGVAPGNRPANPNHWARQADGCYQ